MIDADLEWWKAELVGLLGSSKDLPPSDVIAEIRDLAAAMGLDVSEALLDTYPELYNYGPALTKAHRRQVFAQNKAEVDQILEQDLDGPVSFRDVAHRRTVELYDRLAEVFAWVDIRDCRRLVMVGCGLKPFTIFHFHDKTSIPEIVGLDVEPEAIEATTSLATKLSYERVSAKQCDGREYDYAGAQIVYVACMVSPKPAVVSRIADTAPDDAQIILWEPYSLSRLWAERAENDLDPRLEVVDRGSVSAHLSRDIFVSRRRATSRESAT